MKIGQFSDSFLPIVDGVGRVVYHYCDTLGKKEEVAAIVPMEDMGYRGRFPFEIIDYYSANVPLTVYNAGVPDLDIHFHKRMEMERFDIVHVHTPFIAGLEGIRYAHHHKVPLVGSFHSKYYDDFLQITGSKHLAEFGTDVIVSFYEKCDEVWTVSENSAETLRSYGYDKAIRVIGNGSDIKEIDPLFSLQAKEHFGLGEDPVLLYVGQINYKKNLLRILEAASLLKKQGEHFQLVFAGKGPHEEDIRKKAKELDIEDRLVMTGHLYDENLLEGLYSLSDLFVFPSNYDTYSMVVREAAMAKTASVVLRDSAPAECIKEGYNGLLCEDDSEDLCRVISKALHDKEKLKKLGEAAHDTIPVSWEKIGDEILAQYRCLIDTYKTR